MGMSAGESDAGDVSGPRITYRPETRRVYPPHELLNLPDGHGLVWLAGQSRPQPVYAPPYWDIRVCAQRARRNPSDLSFYPGRMRDRVDPLIKCDQITDYRHAALEIHRQLRAN